MIYSVIHLIILVLLFTLSAVLTSRYKKASVYVLIVLSVLLHKELFSFYKWDLLPVRAFMLAISAVTFWEIVKKLKHQSGRAEIVGIIKDPLVFTVGLLWVVRLASLIFTKNLPASLNVMAFFTTVVLLSVYLKLAFVDFDKNEPEKYLHFFVGVVFVLSLFGYFQLGLYSSTGKIVGALWNIPGNIARVGSTFWDVNHYGSLLAGIIPFVGVAVLTSVGWKKRLLNFFVALCLTASLLLTNSRTAWILAFVTFVMFCFILLVRKLGGLKAFSIILAVSVMISAPMVVEYNKKDSPFRAKIRQYFHYRMDSFDSHFMLLTGSYQIFEKLPVLGGGYGSFFENFKTTKISAQFFGRDPAALNTRVPPHTIWGELISETGVLGLTAFLSLVFVLGSLFLYNIFYATDRKKILNSAVSFSVLVGWLTAGIFYSYNSEFFWLIFFLLYFMNIAYLPAKVTVTEVVEKYLRSPKFLLGCLIVISSVLLFTSLGKNHLIPWDEAIYAKIAKNMVAQKEFLTQHWWPNKVWYEKPPLYMWLMSVGILVGGFNSWAVRLPSAIFGLLTVVLVFKAGSKLFSKTAGFFGGLALITTTQYLYYARASMLDVTATFFMSAGLVLYFFSKTSKSFKPQLLAGICLGLAVMTKGVVGLLPFGVIGLYELLLIVLKFEKFSFKIIRDLLSVFAVSMLVFLPWHVYMYVKFGNAFISNYIGYHVLDRALSAIEDKGRPIWWYLEVLKVSMRIWFVPLVPALAAAIYSIFKKDKKLLFTLTWFVVILGFFSVAKSKLVWYIIPVYVPAVILVGWFIDKTLLLVFAKFKKLNHLGVKVAVVVLITVFSLTYLFYYRYLAYTSDTTGSAARLLVLKDATFGDKQKVYVDRVELPLVMAYTDGPFEIIDFRPDVKDRIPAANYNEKLVLLTKAGRYASFVPTQRYPSQEVKKDGDYVLWYFESEFDSDTKAVKVLTKRISEIDILLLDKCNCTTPELIVAYNQEKKDLEKRIADLNVFISKETQAD